MRIAVVVYTSCASNYIITYVYNIYRYGIGHTVGGGCTHNLVAVAVTDWRLHYTHTYIYTTIHNATYVEVHIIIYSRTI